MLYCEVDARHIIHTLLYSLTLRQLKVSSIIFAILDYVRQNSCKTVHIYIALFVRCVV